MAITNQQIFNACLAGVAGGLQLGRQPEPVGDISAVINAAAQAAEAVIAATMGTIVGGGNNAQQDLAQGLCTALLANRDGVRNASGVLSSTVADWNGVFANLGAQFNFINAQINGLQGKQLLVAGNPGSITAPQTALLTATSAALIGANDIIATFDGVPTNTGLGIQAAWMTTKPSVDGQFNVAFVKVSGNYTGASENLLLTVQR